MNGKRSRRQAALPIALADRRLIAWPVMGIWRSQRAKNSQLHHHHGETEQLCAGSTTACRVLKPEAWPMWLARSRRVRQLKALLGAYRREMICWPVAAVGCVKKNDPLIDRSRQMTDASVTVVIVISCRLYQNIASKSHITMK